MALSEEELQEVKETFDHFDTDSNGVIDRDEFRALLKALDPGFDEDDVLMGLKVLDANENDVIDWEEFRDWWGGR
ncbi:MAG: EF-hand domain-containing protein [Actinobacteria bacterium]|nr:EF-hand domain-containing protein [Actinomycetota bacterium]NIX20677.1 EF-hand domain-containing protein [Actinomycetota bacterium]